MTRRKQREDPVYLQAMREAKELFDAEILKSSMRRAGRPPKVATAAAVEEDVHVVDDPPAPRKSAKGKKR